MQIIHPEMDPAFIEQCHRDVVEGVTKAIDREVARRRRQGLPIHVWQDGKVVDLQQQQESSGDG